MFYEWSKWPLAVVDIGVRELRSGRVRKSEKVDHIVIVRIMVRRGRKNMLCAEIFKFPPSGVGGVHWPPPPRLLFYFESRYVSSTWDAVIARGGRAAPGMVLVATVALVRLARTSDYRNYVCQKTDFPRAPNILRVARRRRNVISQGRVSLSGNC